MAKLNEYLETVDNERKNLRLKLERKMQHIIPLTFGKALKGKTLQQQADVLDIDDIKRMTIKAAGLLNVDFDTEEMESVCAAVIRELKSTGNKS